MAIPVGGHAAVQPELRQAIGQVFSIQQKRIEELGDLARNAELETLAAHKEKEQMQGQLNDQIDKTKRAETTIEDLQKELREIQVQNGRLNQNIAILQRQLQPVREQENLGNQEIANLKLQIKDYAAQIERLKGREQELIGQLAGFQEQLVQEQRKVNDLQRQLLDEREKRELQEAQITKREKEKADIRIHREKRFNSLMSELHRLQNRYEFSKGTVAAGAAAIILGATAVGGIVGYLVGSAGGSVYVAAKGDNGTKIMKQVMQRLPEIKRELIELGNLLGKRPLNEGIFDPYAWNDLRYKFPPFGLGKGGKRIS